MNYIREIEEQNEDLRRRLAEAESRAAERDTYKALAVRILRKSERKVIPGMTGIKYVAINSSDLLISEADVGKDGIAIIESIFSDLKKEKDEFSEKLLKDFASCFSGLTRQTVGVVSSKENT